MRLIDADALKAEFKVPTDWLDSKQVFTHVTGIWAEIDAAPTVELGKEGEWEECGDGQSKWYVCPICHYQTYDATNFCPNCGAKMEGEDDGTD